MINFLVSFAGKGDSMSVVWENFHIYKARMQEVEDNKDLIMLKKALRLLEEKLLNEHGTLREGKIPSADFDKLTRLRHNQASARIWFQKLNEHVVKSLQKVSDREAKSKEGVKLPGIMKAETINFNIQDKKGGINE